MRYDIKIKGGMMPGYKDAIPMRPAGEGRVTSDKAPGVPKPTPHEMRGWYSREELRKRVERLPYYHEANALRKTCEQRIAQIDAYDAPAILKKQEDVIKQAEADYNELIKKIEELDNRTDEQISKIADEARDLAMERARLITQWRGSRRTIKAAYTNTMKSLSKTSLRRIAREAGVVNRKLLTAAKAAAMELRDNDATALDN